MTISIWRYGHLLLAIISSLFLLILSITGVILAIDAIYEKTPSYKIDDLSSVSLAQAIPALYEVYPEITELSVDHNDFVTLDASDNEGNSTKSYIDPRNGKVLGAFKPKSQFIETTIALHRSLFLHETGRIIIGIVSFLLFLITSSGVVLIIKRQQGIRHFWAKINRDFFAQYFHVASGRLSLIPIILIALSGTYLFLVRIDIIKKTNEQIAISPVNRERPSLKIEDFPIFRQIVLTDVEKVEFPFMLGDAEEVFVLKLKDRIISVNQINGEIIEETRYPYTAVLEKLSLDVHTGRTNVIWAIILGFASLNIVAFIYTGFVITFKRTRTKIKNQYSAENAEIVLLVGTENGSTLFFANQIYQQLLADGKRALITEMNKFSTYPKAQHLLVFTSTYGLGVAPANATNFERLVRKTVQQQTIQFAVVGFGSKAYPDFCGYAEGVDQLLGEQRWASRYLDLHTVNDKSADDLVKWIHAWSEKSLIALATAPALYTTKQVGLENLKVIEKTLVSEDNSTFRITLAPERRSTFQSGDLLAIYPASDSRERFYSIGQNNGNVQLVVKLYEDGLGSGYLYRLEVNSKLKARIMHNPGFHFPTKTGAVAMIANGTGIAPFLGMVMNNRNNIPVRMYAGFRYDNELTEEYRQFALLEMEQKRLESLSIAYSRGTEPQYVMDLIRRDAQYFIDLLANQGVIMICGSLRMQHDVELVLEELCLSKGNQSFSFYKSRNQLMTDCY